MKRTTKCITIAVFLYLLCQSAVAVEPDPNYPPYDFFIGNQDDTQGYDSDPVNTARGSFYHEHTDLSIESRGLELVFRRFYNSEDMRGGPFGQGWGHTYYVVLYKYPWAMIPSVEVRWADGHSVYWMDDTDGEEDYPPLYSGICDDLSKNEDDSWKVKKKNLEVYHFDEWGRLESINDKNGNSITCDYNDPIHWYSVTKVTDPAGRSLLLNYDSNGFLTSITDFASPSRTVQYSYTDGKLTQVTDVLGNTIVYTYDSNNLLTTITDQRGIAIVANTYDSYSRVVEQRDGKNKSTYFTYTVVDGRVKTTITDPNGKVSIHKHNPNHWLLESIEDPLGGTILYTYDSNTNRTSITDRNDKTTNFTYDGRGSVTAMTEPNNPTDPFDGGVTLVEYNDPCFPDLPTKKVDALGSIVLWEYDVNGDAIRQTNPDGNEINWTYNSFGQKLTETDENGNTTTYIYDANGLLMEVIDANSNHIWYGYDNLWRLTHLTNGRGSHAGDPNHTVVTTYDNENRIISAARPITSESYQYDKVGNRTKVVNGRGYTTAYEYDNNNNLVKVERIIPAGPNQITLYAYDELNRKISEIDPNDNITTFNYDAAGRVIKETNPEGNETSYTYDPQGNILSATDGNDVTVFYEYDALNRKMHQYDELGNHWYWQYNKIGKMTKHTDAMGYKTSYEYDCTGRLVAVINDSNNRTEYTYDKVGNLTQVKDVAGKIIEKRYYNAANRFIRKEDGSGNAYEYTYDGTGNIISEKSPNGYAKTYTYDNENRLIKIHYPDSNQVTYSYDNNGNLLTMTDTTGITTYTYDTLDRLTDSNDSFGKTVEYEYDSVGNRISITYPADSTNPARTVTYEYDKAYRLDKITDWASRVWDYTTDGAGRVIDVNYPGGVIESRTYDDAGRLASLHYKNSSDVNLISYAYTRDAQGNPTDVNETGTLPPDFSALFGKTAYTHDNDNRLTSSTVPATYGYDNRGNMTSRVTGGVTTTFAYDFESRLISQTTGGSTVQHTYDGNGNRIARNDNGTTTLYVLDHGRDMSHVLCETDAAGEIIAYYIHGPTIVGRIAADDTASYYHTNAIGSVVALTDDTESVTDQYAYTPFGEPTGKTGSTANPFTYIGSLGVMAEDDGLYFMRARFYDAESGRFITKDPVEGTNTRPDTFNLYNYVQNQPTILVDPQGRFVFLGPPSWIDIIGQYLHLDPNIALMSEEEIKFLMGEIDPAWWNQQIKAGNIIQL